MSSGSGGGSWDPVIENALQIVGVHAVVLWTGKVLYFSFDQRAVGQLNVDKNFFYTYFTNPNLGSYQVWDPVTQKAVGPPKPIGRNAFCAGQCALPDGTIFVAGGQDQYGAIELGDAMRQFTGWLGDAVIGGSDEGALKDIHTYDPVQDGWTLWGTMPDGRYYPTCLELPSGSAFVAGGLSNLQRWVFSGGNWCENDQFEVYAPGLLAFGSVPRKFMSADQYPIIRLLPGTHSTLFVHVETTSYLFDADSGSKIEGAEFMPPGVGRQTYPMQTGHALLPQKEGDPPRIFMAGGSTATGFDYNTHSDAPGVQDAFIFDFNPTSPSSSSWRKTKGQMHDPRLLSDTVLLPDGTVFVVNGIVKGAAAGHSGKTVGTAEIFDPITETFTQTASPDDSKHPRGYHSTAVLLPDGRVAISGNTASYNPGENPSFDDVSIQVYNPPYLTMGQRPVVSTPIPSSLDYGSTLTIDNSAAPMIDAVMLMRPCAVTHTVDMDQRAVQLVVGPGSHGASNLDIMIPTDRSLAPPGPYMLFFLSKGVPSVASFVFIGVPAPSPPQQGQPDCSNGGPYPSLNLGARVGPGGGQEGPYPGDVTYDKIDNGYKLIVESSHGSIFINHKIDQHSDAILTACGNVFIGEKIDQHSTANITTKRGGVTIIQKIDQGAKATINSAAEIEIGQKIDQWSGADMTAGSTVHIGEKIDQHSTVTIVAQGDVNIDQGIDGNAGPVDITSVNGSIIIGQAVDGGADVTLRAPNGSITIAQKVAGGAKVKWHALSFNCPDTSGGTVSSF